MDKTLKIKNLIIPDSYSGVLLIGDAHGDYESYEKATLLADSKNLFLISLGDIVDYGPNSVDIFRDLSQRIADGSAEMVLGNHELKNWKYFTQKKLGEIKVSVAQKHLVSIRGFENASMVDDLISFLDERPHIITMNYSNSDIVLVHAAVCPEFWHGKYHRRSVNTAFFGEVNQFDPVSGMPIRLYNWIDSIPKNKCVFVGHAPHERVTKMQGKNAGPMYFVDTGCSKGGYLSGVELNPDTGNRVHAFI